MINCLLEDGFGLKQYRYEAWYEERIQRDILKQFLKTTCIGFYDFKRLYDTSYYNIYFFL